MEMPSLKNPHDISGREHNERNVVASKQRLTTVKEVEAGTKTKLPNFNDRSLPATGD